MTQTVVFDVDGTLCDTCAVDDELYRATAAAHLGVDSAAISWRDAPHITDTGIADWLWTRHRGRGPDAVESERFAAAFETALRAEWDRAPARFAPIAGASEFLRTVELSGWRYAIATGGRARSARLKLTVAGLPAERLLASSDDSPDRGEIFALALRQLLVGEPLPPSRVVLVGDGIWDVHTAARLGWAMVGVGRDARAERLRAAGASHVIADFRAQDEALTALREASVPRPV